MSLAPAIQFGLLAQAACGLTIGGAAGLGYFHLLWRNAALFARGRVGAAALMQSARFAALALVLFGLTRLGAAALLAALFGIVLARETIKRRARPPS